MQDIRSVLIAAFETALPGENAHQLIMPDRRVSASRVLDEGITHRKSAVLVLLYPRTDIWHFVLLKRHEYEGAHSGQVGLPGGKEDPEDKDSLATALRECHEETGIHLHEGKVVGRLTPLFIPPSGFLVQPYVGVMDTEPRFRYDPREVRYGIEVPLSELLDESAICTVIQDTEKYGRLKTKGYDFDGEIVWGATSMVLTELREMLLKSGAI